MSGIKIEKSVPMPSGPGKRGRMIYPWDEMDVGDSFFVDGVSSAAMSACASAFGRRNGKKFTCRKEGTGTRVWRVE